VTKSSCDSARVLDNPPAGAIVKKKALTGDAVMYDHVMGNAVSSHVRACWVQAGTWIGLHLSTNT
jgi:hypothetical protein